MNKKYTDGAKALIGTLIFSSLLALAAIGVLIVGVTDPNRNITNFNAPEFISEKDEKNCHFERPLAAIEIEQLEEWLEASTTPTMCVRKRPDGFWMIFPFEKIPKK